MICSLCGKKIRWWQKRNSIKWHRLQRVQVDGLCAIIPYKEVIEVTHHHRKCYPGMSPMEVSIEGACPQDSGFYGSSIVDKIIKGK